MDALIAEKNIFGNIKCKQTCSELRVDIKDWSPSRCSDATVGLICSTDICLSTLGIWTAYVE